MIWALLILGTIFASLVALKGWSWVRARSLAAAEGAADTFNDLSDDFETEWSKIDDYVDEAWKLYPALRAMPLFYVALVFSAGMIVLDIIFGWSRGGDTLSFVALVYILLFVGADIALPIVALQSDKGTADWHDLQKSDRSHGAWALIGLFTFMSIIVVIGSTSEVATKTSARNDAAVMTLGELKSKIANKTLLRDELVTRRVANGGRSREALEKLAVETQEAADREGKRVRCADKCEKLKKKAAAYSAQAKDAREEDELNEELALLNAQLEGAGNLRTDADPLARAGEAIGVPAAATKAWGLTFLGVFFAIGTTVLWLIVADAAGRYRAREYAKRAERGNAKLADYGMEPRYMTEDRKAAEVAAAEPGASVQLQIEENADGKIARSEALTAIHKLVPGILVEDEASHVTFGTLYAIYKGRAAASGADTWMSQAEFNRQLDIYADIKRMRHSSSRLIGYRIEQSKTTEESQPKEG